MADNINFNTQRGTHSFVSRKQIPWHRKGQIFDRYMTTEEAIKACNADYEVGLAEVYAKFPKELWQTDLKTGIAKRGEKVPNIFATYRKDNLHVLGAVGSRYEVIQNIEAFTFIDDIVVTGEAVIETAGVLGNGERVFVTAKLPDYITLSNGDTIESYLFITMAHDGSGMITAALTSIRIVCNNTLNMALRNCTNKIAFKHTRNVRDRLAAGQQLMGLHNKFNAELNNALQYMNTIKVDDKLIAETIYQLVLTPEELALARKNNYETVKITEISTRKKNTLRDILLSVQDGPGQNLYRGTGLWLYNGVTTYLGNTKQYSTEDDRLMALTSGTESKLAQRAFDLISNIK